MIMKVICERDSLSLEEKVLLGYNKELEIRYPLTVGMEYTVLGINFQSDILFNKGTVILLRDDIGGCAFVPLCLLGITEPGISKYWLVEKKGAHDLLMWPKEFYLDYFHDDLSDGVASVRQLFDTICQVLDAEKN